jgi:DNA (cytosine-5)-methyltransferase 1
MTRKLPPKKRTIAGIDLFCGAGGLTHGLRLGGIKVVAGIDIDPATRFAFEANNPGAKFILKRIEDISKTQLDQLWDGATERLLAGCAPCQPFSTYSQARSHTEDCRWRLLDEFSRLVRAAEPEHVTMENVPSLRNNPVFLEFLETLISSGYRVWHGVVDCSSFGLPQARYRLVLLATKLGTAAPELKMTQLPRSVRETLDGLPRLKAGERDSQDSVHRCARLSVQNLRRIRISSPGGTWRDWPKKLRCRCHRRKTGDGYLAVYGRMQSDGLAPTITTQCYNYGSGRFGHPTQDRAISLREAALLQGFPVNYSFEAPSAIMPTRDLARLIGNAVPPPLGIAIADAFLKFPTEQHAEART